MDFKDSIKDVSKRSSVARHTAETEEATKNSVVMPFIRALGFDVFDLGQVVPEYVADVGVKKGEKVDYALKIDGKVVMLIEVKPITMDLGRVQYSQLYRYFGTETGAKIAILTNGAQIWFFTDIDAPNKMDKRPFFIFDLESYDDDDLNELAKFQRDHFNVEGIVETASQLKYSNAAAAYIESLLEKPDEEFIRLVGKQIYDGNITKSVVDMLCQPISFAFKKVIRDQIQQRLDVALGEPPVAATSSAATSEGEKANKAPSSDDGIVTTDEEISGYRIVQAIASEVADPSRVIMRDAKSYCSILFDDNNRKPICRLYFNAKSVKYVGIFDQEKNETRQQIEAPTDIFRHKSEVLAAVKGYL